MKTYKKAELIAKNLPTGSYAAGCPANVRGVGGIDPRRLCINCEIAQ